MIARGSLATIADPGGGSITLPGPVAHLLSTPAVAGAAPVDPVLLDDVLSAWT